MVVGEPAALVRPFEGRKPESVFDSARCLRRCRSTPALSFTAVSLLSKTLNARATRLESTASRARLAAEKEAYKRMTIAKRRRALGPKNASEFMRQTIRDREKARGRNKDMVERRAGNTSLLDGSNRSSGSSVRPVERDMSKPALDLPFQQSTRSPDRDHSALPSVGSPQACSSHDGSLVDNKERSWAHEPIAIPTPARVNLEDDDDVRDLLDRAQFSRSCTSTGDLPRPATSCVRRPGKAMSTSSRPFGQPRAGGEPPSLRRSSSAKARGFCVRRPHTAGAHGRENAKETNPSEVVQRRREMLIRSHGEGRNVRLFAAEQFETTAMGRKKCYSQPELAPWIPANTLAGLDRIKRSRMLMNQRPVVSRLPSSWT